MKLLRYSVCLTSKSSILIIVSLLLSTIVIASVWPKNVVIKIDKVDDKMWVPTEEDILYQDSMFSIIESTQNDITDIKEDIVLILERLDYEDGTYDSIRYVKGGPIDKRRN